MADNKITKRMKEFLEWAYFKGEFSSWPIEWSVMMKKARKQGFVETTHKKDRLLSVFIISETGKQALHD